MIAAETLNGHPCRVLVVEDEALIAMLVEDMIHDSGGEMVGPAVTLSDAVDLARNAMSRCSISTWAALSHIPWRTCCDSAGCRLCSRAATDQPPSSNAFRTARSWTSPLISAAWSRPSALPGPKGQDDRPGGGTRNGTLSAASLCRLRGC